MRGCFLEGFEAETVSSWAIESIDVSAYTVAVDTEVVRSGRHSLRLTGGSSVNFDGLRATLPSHARPRNIAFWLRTSAEGNVGYLTLGGISIQVCEPMRWLRATHCAWLRLLIHRANASPCLHRAVAAHCQHDASTPPAHRQHTASAPLVSRSRRSHRSSSFT